MSSHLLTIGGGGYYGPQGGPSHMIQYLLKLTKKKYPKICLIPTASPNKVGAIQDFIFNLNKYGAHPNFLDLYNIPTKDLEDWLLSFDAIYISGGNTRNLLALWKAWGLDGLLIKAWQNGVVMSGASAGAICWFEEGNSDFIPGELNVIEGLAQVSGSCCPHYSDTKNRRQSYLDMVADGQIKSGFGLSDRAAVYFKDGEYYKSLIEWEEAGVYKVEKNEKGDLVETKMEAELI